MFESFDTALPIEATAALTSMPEPSAAEGWSLQDALREAGLAEAAVENMTILDRRAAKAELTLLDLWVERGGASHRTALHTIEPARGGEGTTLVAAGELATGKDPAVSASTSPPGGGEYVDENGNGQWDPGEEILVNGTRPRTADDDSDWVDFWSGGGGGGGEDQPGGGSTGSGTSSQKVADHPQDCGTDDGAAVQVAKHVMGIPLGAGPPNPLLAGGSDWTRVEFGAVIVRNEDGTYGALNDAIYSNAAAGYVHTPDFEGTNAQGIWHNHPRRDDSDNAMGFYPSSDPGGHNDWDALQQLKDAVAPNDPNFDPSLWIMGPDGVTREFKLSEREYYENLTAEQMKAREGLDGKERNQSCG